MVRWSCGEDAISVARESDEDCGATAVCADIDGRRDCAKGCMGAGSYAGMGAIWAFSSLD